MKKLLIITVIMCFAMLFAGCGEKKIVHCDGCGKEIKISADSNMTEDWIILCDTCKEKIPNE